MNKREYLVSKGLAKPGRGRFSREALAALRQAELDGIEFDDGQPRVPEAHAEAAEQPTVYEPVVTAKVRDIGESNLFGYTKEGWKVGFVTCRRCHMHANYCNCSQGLLPPSIVETIDPDSLAMIG